MANEKTFFLLFGAQASGKGTQGKLLSEELSVPHISTGRLIRQVASQPGDLGKKLAELMEGGYFISDDLMNELLLKRLQESDVSSGFILDGYPRNMKQTEFFQNYLETLENYKLLVFNLLIDPATILKRVEGRFVCENCGRNYNIYFFPSKLEGVCDDCGHKLVKRADDTEAVIKERYKIFLENTQPVIDFYKKMSGIYFFDVNGEQEIPAIFNDIKKYYYDKVKNN